MSVGISRAAGQLLIGATRPVPAAVCDRFGRLRDRPRQVKRTPVGSDQVMTTSRRSGSELKSTMFYVMRVLKECSFITGRVLIKTNIKQDIDETYVEEEMFLKPA